jgi:hypothetical protein
MVERRVPLACGEVFVSGQGHGYEIFKIEVIGVMSQSQASRRETQGPFLDFLVILPAFFKSLTTLSAARFRTGQRWPAR